MRPHRFSDSRQRCAAARPTLSCCKKKRYKSVGDSVTWASPSFMQTNDVITPGLPQAVGFVAIVAALLGAVAFTGWYSTIARTARGAQ